jgi:hypothetical protein
MNNEQSQAKPTRRHTIDVHTPSMIPRFNIVLPSYNRDRRVSSITSVIPPETIINGIPANSEQNSVSSETANNQKGLLVVLI